MNDKPLDFKKESELESTKGFKRVRNRPLASCIKCKGTGVRKRNKAGREFYCDCMQRFSR